MERENQLQVFSLKNGILSSTPIFVRTTLADPSNARPAQVVGPIHFPQDGRFVYLANRSDGTVDYQGKKVYVGGENSVAVFRVSPQSGEPTLIQAVPTQSYHCRTFTLNPNGNMLVTASIGAYACARRRYDHVGSGSAFRVPHRRGWKAYLHQEI